MIPFKGTCKNRLKLLRALFRTFVLTANSPNPTPTVYRNPKLTRCGGVGIFCYSGFHFDPHLASRDDIWLTMAAISLKKGGGVPFSFPQNPTGCSQNLKISILSGVTAISGL